MFARLGVQVVDRLVVAAGQQPGTVLVQQRAHRRSDVLVHLGGVGRDMHADPETVGPPGAARSAG